MKYFISYDAVEDVVSVRDVLPELSVDADYDEDYGLYRAWVEADDKEQAIRKAFTMFIDVADKRVRACVASFDSVKNKLIEVMS